MGSSYNPVLGFKWALARQATKHALPAVAASSCHFPEPASPACLLLGLGGCSHAKCPCQGIFGSLREPLCLPLRTCLFTSRLVAFGQAGAEPAPAAAHLQAPLPLPGRAGPSLAVVGEAVSFGTL